MNEYLTIEEIAERYKIERDYAAYRLTKRPGFPKAIVIGRNLKRWKRAEVDEWENGKARERTAGRPRKETA